MKLGKILQLSTHPRYRRGLWQGVAAAVEHRAFLRSSKFATLIDVGANKGQFSLVAHTEQPGIRIIAFEPLSQEAAKFESMFADTPNVTLIRAAAGGAFGQAQIHVSRRADSSSLLPIGKLQSQIFPGTDEIATESVAVVRLADALAGTELAKPVLLKMDVQGFELEVLKGAESILGTLHAIYVEVSFLRLYDGQPLAHEVISWLSDHKFILSGVYHIAVDRDCRAVQADMYFRRRED